MSDECFQAITVAEFRAAPEEFHARVAEGHGRIELTANGSGHTCVLISKQELDSLERALEILANTTDYHAMGELVREAADVSGGAPTVSRDSETIHSQSL